MCVLLAIRPYLLYADLRQLQLFTVRGRAHCCSLAVSNIEQGASNPGSRHWSRGPKGAASSRPTSLIEVENQQSPACFSVRAFLLYLPAIPF